MENWAVIEEFPNYEVSDQGRVRNKESRRVLGLYDNGHGVIQLVLRKNGKPYARAVHKLVAIAFLDPGPEDYVPIHLDHNWENNRADNLEWKSSVYAMKRTRQQKQIIPRDPRPVRIVNTGEVYKNALECAKAIDGFEDLVLITARNGYNGSYLGLRFEFCWD